MLRPRTRGLPSHAAALALLLSGCATVPSLGSAPKMRDAATYPATRVLAPATDPAATWPDGAWWHGYGDPQLDTLMAEALAGSPDIAAAAARLHRADGYRQQSGAALRPRIDAKATVVETKQSYDNGLPSFIVRHGWNDAGSASLSFGFDLDLWGKNRANLRAATSAAQAAALDAAQTRLVLSTNVAGAYADLARLFAERDVQAEAVAVRMDSQRLVADRLANGLDSRAELKQADAAVPAERARLVQIDEAIALTRSRLAALIGAGPDRGLAIARPTLSPSARAVPADVTTDLVGRRSDVAASRARVLADADRIKAAHADFYPSVSISALVGVESFGLSNLLMAGSTFGKAGPAISLPIFHGGELAGRYRVARADYDEAVANYDGAVANAFREVADAVTSSAMLVDELARSREALAAADEAQAIARRRYAGGLSTYLTVLVSQTAALDARRAVVDLEARGVTLDIALVRALGGGAISPSTLVAGAGDIRKEPTHG